MKTKCSSYLCLFYKTTDNNERSINRTSLAHHRPKSNLRIQQIVVVISQSISTNTITASNEYTQTVCDKYLCCCYCRTPKITDTQM